MQYDLNLFGDVYKGIKKYSMFNHYFKFFPNMNKSRSCIYLNRDQFSTQKSFESHFDSVETVLSNFTILDLGFYSIVYRVLFRRVPVVGVQVNRNEVFRGFDKLVPTLSKWGKSKFISRFYTLYIQKAFYNNLSHTNTHHRISVH